MSCLPEVLNEGPKYIAQSAEGCYILSPDVHRLELCLADLQTVYKRPQMSGIQLMQFSDLHSRAVGHLIVFKL
jgi:hypothetical protein